MDWCVIVFLSAVGFYSSLHFTYSSCIVQFLSLYGSCSVSVFSSVLVLDCFPLEHFRDVRNIAKNDCYLHHVCLSVCLPIHMENLFSHWTDFHKIMYSSMLRKSVEETQVSFKSDKNNGYFT
jgi:hypothetical protein